MMFLTFYSLSSYSILQLPKTKDTSENITSNNLDSLEYHD
jgi:hypothetical protein